MTDLEGGRGWGGQEDEARRSWDDQVAEQARATRYFALVAHLEQRRREAVSWDWIADAVAWAMDPYMAGATASDDDFDLTITAMRDLADVNDWADVFRAVARAMTDEDRRTS